eukprot:scaffold283404_cov38-Attheya_sp.AAC.2
MVATQQRHSPLLGCGYYATAVATIDENVGMRPSARAVSSTHPHPDSSSMTMTCHTGHVIMNHSVVMSCRGDKCKVDAAASAGGTGTNCGHIRPANDFGDQECHDIPGMAKACIGHYVQACGGRTRLLDRAGGAILDRGTRSEANGK